MTFSLDVLYEQANAYQILCSLYRKRKETKKKFKARVVTKYKLLYIVYCSQFGRCILQGYAKKNTRAENQSEIGFKKTRGPKNRPVNLLDLFVSVDNGFVTS